MKPTTLKVRLSQLDKSLFYQGKNGPVLDLVAFPVKQSKYGETHILKQGRPKGSNREMPIVGDMELQDGSGGNQGGRGNQGNYQQSNQGGGYGGNQGGGGDFDW